MNTPTYDQSGTLIAIAGLIAAALARWNVIVDPASIVTVLAGLVTLYGVIRQAASHKNLAQATGVYPKA